MKIEFGKLSDTSRLWVYQAERALNAQELAQLEQITEVFIEGWEAHGKPLAASYEVRFNQFLVVSVDESFNGATGCSIDASVALVRKIQDQLGISFLDRSKVAVLDGETVSLTPMAELKRSASTGQIAADTKIFNNSVSTLADYESQWILPAKDSWLSRYFN